MSRDHMPKPVAGEWACGWSCDYQGALESFEQTVMVGDAEETIYVCPKCGVDEYPFPTDDETWPGQKYGEELRGNNETLIEGDD